ncbi:MAG TPA: hypothetical protein VNH83_16595 [Bryobacteraceae bacterium]|nr:hypothetical protein [Bryobacteraceae bacterium]
MAINLPKGVRNTIESILGNHIFRVAREDALMQAATAVLDAQQERDRLKLLLEAVRGELRTLAAIQMSQRGVSRLVLTRKEFDAVDEESEVHIESPEPGVRIYEMRRKGVMLNG